MDKYLFETMVDGAPKTPARDTFMEAWDDMYQHVKSLQDAGTLSWQLLETAMWIKTPNETLYFPDARDKAIREFNWQHIK